jgi:hypothetical protein
MNIIKEDDFDEALDHLSRDFHHHRGFELRPDWNQRDRERKMRESLKSRHGPTAEIHDQVFPSIFSFFHLKISFQVLQGSQTATGAFPSTRRDAD